MKLASTAMAWGAPNVPLRVRSAGPAVLTIAAVLVFTVLVWIGASGVRGTDQYWYVADVEALIEGRGVQTNEIYPVSIRHDIAPLPRPFVHNILNVYVVALPAMALGSYGGWIVVNLLGSLLTAFLIFGTVVRISDSRPAASIVAATYLLLPLTVWLTIQPLAEASIAPLVALAVYLYATAGGSYLRWLFLLSIVGLLVYCRESFILLLPLVPLAYVVHAHPLRLRNTAGAVGLVIGGGLLWLLGKQAFEPHIAASYMQVLGGAGPNASNMNSYFDLSPMPPTALAILAKVAEGLAIQFTRVNAGYLLFYLPFNLMALAPLALLIGREREGPARVAMAGVAAVALHLIAAIIVQNQFRYLLTATPPLLAALGILLGRADRFRPFRLSTLAMTAGVLILAAPSATVAWRSHTEAILERAARERLAAAFDEVVPIGDTVMVAIDLTAGFEGQLVGFVLRPRRTLYASDRYGANDYAALIRSVNASWLMSPRDSRLLDRLAPDSIREARTLPIPYADWSLFSIESRTLPP